MKAAIILNGIARRKKYFYNTLLPAIRQCVQADVFETQSPGHAVTLAHNATQQDYSVIIAAGGDGTIHQVLNGMLTDEKQGEDLPALAILPLGSGNDFARSLNIRAKPKEVQQLIKSPAQWIDVGRIQYQAEGKSAYAYFMNVADVGIGPEVLRQLRTSKKWLGAGLAYYAAILKSFFTYKSLRVSVKTPEWQWENKLRTLAVCNGKFYGHGLGIAPDARIDDGVLNTFICGDVSVVDFIRYSSTLKKLKQINHAKISYTHANRLEVNSTERCGVEADGELLGWLPAVIELVPGRIRLLCNNEAL